MLFIIMNLILLVDMIGWRIQRGSGYDMNYSGHCLMYTRAKVVQSV